MATAAWKDSVVGDDVIRRHHEDRIAAVPRRAARSAEVGAVLRPVGSGTMRAPSLPAAAQLLRDHETVRAIANDDGRRDTFAHLASEAVEAADGFLQHGVQTGERKEAVWLVFAGKRPQTGAGATGRDDGSKHREINKYRRLGGRSENHRQPAL